MSLAALVVRALGATLRLAPLRAARAAGEALGWVWFWVVPIRRGVVRTNLARAFPELSRRDLRRLAEANFRHYGRTLVEVLRAQGAPPDEADLEGGAHLDQALALGRGVLVLTAHLGAFERLVRAPTVRGARLWVVTRRFKVGSAQRAWMALRGGGAGLLAAGASARQAVAALRRNEVVAYVLDQHDPGRRAVVAPFFGRQAATSPDLARLSRLTGAPVVPVFTWWDGSRHRTRAEPPVSWDRAQADADRVGTIACQAVVEAAIRRAPTQWLWLHRRWKVAERSRAACATAHSGGS